MAARGGFGALGLAQQQDGRDRPTERRQEEHHVLRPAAQPVLRHQPLNMRQLALGKISHEQHQHVLALGRDGELHIRFVGVDLLVGHLARLGDAIQAVQRA